MRRLVLIAAAVLIPFAALVWWGLSALSHEPLPLPPAQAPVVSAPAPLVPPAPSATAPVVVAPPIAAPVEPVVPPPAPPGTEEALRADVIAQITPMVQQCFIEMSDRLKAQTRVNAVFNLAPDGALADVRVKMKSADPYLVACVQDALEGAKVDPSRGLPAGSVRHVFAFGPQPSK